MLIKVQIFYVIYALSFISLVFLTYLISTYKMNTYKQKVALILILFLISYTAISTVLTMALITNFLIKNYRFPELNNFFQYNEMAFHYLKNRYFTGVKLALFLTFFTSFVFMFGYINSFIKQAKKYNEKLEKYDFISKVALSILSFGIYPFLCVIDFLTEQNRVGTTRILEEGNEVIRDLKKAEFRFANELAIRESNGYKLFKNYRIPRHIEVLNLVITGGMGAGKTVILTPIILQFYESKYPSLILDNKGDFCELLGEKEGVTILSPFDARSPAWNVSEDVATELEAIEFVSQLIQTSGGKGDFFALAARDIALGAIKFLQQTKPFNWHMSEVMKVIGSEDLLTILKEHHPAGLQTLRDCGLSEKTGKMYVGETSAGILQNVRACLQNFDILARAWPLTVGGFSVKKWARGDDSKTLFLIVSFKQLYPEISGFFSGIIIDLFIKESLNLSNSYERRRGLFLDELGAIPRIKSLASGAKLLRQKGVCMFVGIQEVGVLRKKYEADGGTEVILNGFSIKMIGRGETPEYNDYFVRLFGKNRYKKITRSRSKNESGKNSISYSEEQVVEDALSTGELSSIPPASLKNGAIFFVKTSEMPIIFKLKFPIVPLERPYLGYIEAEWMKRPDKPIDLGISSTDVNLIIKDVNLNSEDPLLQQETSTEEVTSQKKEESADLKIIKPQNNYFDTDRLNL